MTDSLTPPTQNLLTTQPSLVADVPTWFTDRVQTAWATFQSLPTPGHKDEHWRYSNAKRIDLSSYHRATRSDETTELEAVKSSVGLPHTSARFIFVNDQLVHSETRELPAGVICETLADALVKHPELMQQYFMQREATLGSAKFAALHLAHARAGAVVIVSRDVEVATPIEVFHWVARDHSTIFPHTLIIAEDNAKVTVIDHYRSIGSPKALSCAVTDIIGKPGSLITYTHCQELAESADAIHLSSTNAQKDATVKSFQVQLGAGFSRSESISDMTGSGSRSDMISVSMPVGTQIVDQRTLQHHAAPRTASDLLYKNALYDTSRTVFAGLITVDEGAHYTDAYQTCRNLLNSEDAEANSMPGLEINADQVKCSHGSTSSPVEEEELFYLKARGISDADSRKLIVQGFLEDTLSRLNNDSLREYIEQRIESKLAAIGRQ